MEFNKAQRIEKAAPRFSGISEEQTHRDMQNTNWDMKLQLNLENVNILTENFIPK